MMSNILEAILFAVGEEGLSKEEISNALEIDEEEVEREIETLQKQYENRAIEVKLLGNKYKLVTKEEYKDYIKKISDEIGNNLSKSALETLAIIAYNEPITRVQIDDIRGVNSSIMLRNLRAKGFIEDVGKSDLPGKPTLYKTTNYFLDYFNLSSRDDLPKLTDEEIEVLEEDLFQTRYKEEGEEI